MRINKAHGNVPTPTAVRSLRGLKVRLAAILPESTYLPIFYYYRKLSRKLEPELTFLPKLLLNCRTAIDVGANRGLYTFLLSKLCHSVIAFEPQHWCAKKIAACNRHNVTVKNIALSNQRGSLRLYVPYDNQGIPMDGLASLNQTLNSQEQIVPVARLDDFNFSEVDFIKIDVEGHESEVIDGGRETIVREKPILLVEIEQRHQVVRIDEVFEKIMDLGYRGFFLRDGALCSMGGFSYDKHQKSYLADVTDGLYVNNFFFVPDSKKIATVFRS